MNLHTILENSVFRKKTYIPIQFIEFIEHSYYVTSYFMCPYWRHASQVFHLSYLRCSQFLAKICKLFIITKSNISLAKTFAQQHFTIPKTKKQRSQVIWSPGLKPPNMKRTKTNQTCVLYQLKIQFSISSGKQISDTNS